MSNIFDSSSFADRQPTIDSFERLPSRGATCDIFRVKVYGKWHILKQLKPEYRSNIRYQEAQRKEFETGYRLEHPQLVRYVSLSDDGILMEYIDGETLTDRINKHSDYFKDKKNTEKFIRQLLDVVGYLHANEVIHLDLKPDNILLTRINNNVKLIDLGCCYTDTFTDTQGHTDRYAAPEQLNGRPVDERTDIYAIGRILEKLPNHHIYNKVIARCTAENPQDRYRTIAEISHALKTKVKKTIYSLIILSIAMIAIILTALLLNTESPKTNVTPVQAKDTIIQVDSSVPVSVHVLTTPPTAVHNLPPQKDPTTRMKEEAAKLIDQAYESTIKTFCDSIFPSPTTGKYWAESTTIFHQRISEISDLLVKNYPQVPESTIRQETEDRFQHLVAYVFNKMRENGENGQKELSETP